MRMHARFWTLWKTLFRQPRFARRRRGGVKRLQMHPLLRTEVLEARVAIADMALGVAVGALAAGQAACAAGATAGENQGFVVQNAPEQVTQDRAGVDLPPIDSAAADRAYGSLSVATSEPEGPDVADTGPLTVRTEVGVRLDDSLDGGSGIDQGDPAASRYTPLASPEAPAVSSGGGSGASAQSTSLASPETAPAAAPSGSGGAVGGARPAGARPEPRRAQGFLPSRERNRRSRIVARTRAASVAVCR